MITACRASSTGDAVNHSLAYGALPDAFSALYLYWLIPDVAVPDVIIAVHVA